jgi:methylenetetrahydromethanopterin dehydrogenase
MVNKMVVKVCFAKLGNIASAPLIEFLLDERAERQDIEVRMVGSGAKMGEEEAKEVAEKIIEFKPDFAITISPNASLPGPKRLREILKNNNIPTIIVSDGPTKKISKELEEQGFGYLIVEADAMIGARREFLDPIEMALFNSDLIKVLAITGAFHVIYTEIDKVIDAFKKREKPIMPKLIINKDLAINSANFQNPYAMAKAIAAHEIAKKVADLTVEGCFIIKEWEKYTAAVAAAHEMMRNAAILADEAREIEKNGDHVLRMPHYDDGTILTKRKLIEKPKK